MTAEILVVDDEADIRKLIRGILEDEGYKVRLAASAGEAYREMEIGVPDLVILDIWLQGSEHDGLQILSKIKADNRHLPVLMISGHGTIETAVSSIKQGAYDFIEKPFKSDRLLLMIGRALEAAYLRQENENLRKLTEKPVQMIAQSPQTVGFQQVLSKLSSANSRVLFTGEPGSGKDVAARYLHSISDRAQKSFIIINCANLVSDRIEEDLFGTKGREDKGLFARADGGIVLLDEVADLSLEAQGKIVRILQEQKLRDPLQNREFDIRILASTNRNLEEMVQEGKFRQDLYYRLNVVPVQVPSLRERVQDIQALTEMFLDEHAAQFSLPQIRFSPEAIRVLQKYKWPGNIRQLRNVTEWVLIMGGNQGKTILEVEDLPSDIAGSRPATSGAGQFDTGMLLSLPLKEAREVFEKEYLQKQIEQFDGNVSKTAQYIGMERSALHRKLKSLQIAGGEKADDPEDQEAKAQRRA